MFKLKLHSDKKIIKIIIIIIIIIYSASVKNKYIQLQVKQRIIRV